MVVTHAQLLATYHDKTNEKLPLNGRHTSPSHSRLLQLAKLCPHHPLLSDRTVHALLTDDSETNTLSDFFPRPLYVHENMLT